MRIEDGAEYLSEIAALEARCFDRPWDERTLRTGGSWSFLVAVEEEICVGYAIFLEGLDCELLRVGVEPGSRRRGVAERLLRARMARGGFGRLLLEVRAGNEAAVQLYEKLGFRRDGVRSGYYHHPTEDALLMGWESE